MSPVVMLLGRVCEIIPLKDIGAEGPQTRLSECHRSEFCGLN